MSIVPTDIRVNLSGGAGNTDPNASLGGAISTTELVDNALHNLFDRVLGAESAAGDVEFRAVFIRNAHATLTLETARVFIRSNTPSPGTHCQISVATEEGSPIQIIPNEKTAPTGQTFSDAAAEGTALVIGNLAPGASRGLWIRREVTAGAGAFSNDQITIEVQGDTTPV